MDRRRHTAACPAACTSCFRYGVGFPCRRPLGQPQQRCDDCGFLFANDDCFAAHKQQEPQAAAAGWAHDRRRGRRQHRSLCEERRICSQCNVLYWTTAARNNHQCRQQRQQQQGQQGAGAPSPAAAATPRCERCKSTHSRLQPCYVQPHKYPLQVKWVENINAASAAGGEEDIIELLGGTGDTDDEAEEQRELQQSKRRPVRFIFWDVESEQLQEEQLQQQQPQDNDEADLTVQRRHVVLLVCAEVICERCIVEGVHLDREPTRRPPGCLCGVPWQQGSAARRRWCMRADPALVAPANMPADGRNPRRLAFHQFNNGAEESAIAQFLDFLMQHGPREARTIALAHNGVGVNLVTLQSCQFQGRYDIIMLLEEMQRQGICPKRLVTMGLRIFQMKLGGGQNQREIVLKDSLNFFGCALGSLPKMFGLEDVEDKPFFPYNFIRAANLHTELQGLPPWEDYEPDGMMPAKRQQLQDWYAEEQRERPQQRWVLAEQLLDYCSNDCRLLRAAALRFRQLVGEHTGGMEPFEAGSTIAGLALAIFRQCHLLADRVVHSPEGGYLRGRRASAASRRFFWVLEHLWSRREDHPVHIQTAQWSIGEANVAEDSGWRLDGVYNRPHPQRPLAIEYNGCFYHGGSFIHGLLN